jgi:poly(ADP-ribose) glycohydrolase ARH3
MAERVTHEQLRDKFLGAMLGTAMGDALGASREGHGLVSDARIGGLIEGSYSLHYTDDTHMTLGVAQSLVECSGFDEAHMLQRFIDNYDQEPWRGYGPGPPRVFRMVKQGVPCTEASRSLYDGGSFGNGGAMRVAPIGLFFWDQPTRLREVAYQASAVTHAHPLGTEGAALQARAVALAIPEHPSQPLDQEAFIAALAGFTTENVYREKLAEVWALLPDVDDRQRVVDRLGHGIEAFNSVPTAIFAFLSHACDFLSTVTYAISLGGDTDTIAAMAGAMSGAYLGCQAIPETLLQRLENRDNIARLAGLLWQTARPAQHFGPDR